ncbi:MAG: hypothetical protein ACP5N9_03755 [Candidatus Bilamarchaeum sp.]
MFVVVLSDKLELRENFCKSLGKEISKNDIAIYNVDGAGKKIWLIDPIQYPEKIQPLLYSLSMADYVVFLVDGLSPKVGELLVAVNSMKISSGIIVSSTTLPTSGTVLDKYEKVSDMNLVKEKIFAASATGSENTFGLVHRTENVASKGHVAFGALKGGKVKKNDRFFMLPHKNEVEVRSLHVGSDELEELSAISNFEMAYKGDLVERGLLVPLRNEFQLETVVNGRFNKSPFFKDEIHGKIYAYSNMQYVEGHVTDNDITLSSSFAFEKGDSILIIDASNQKLRIAGVFQVKW